MMREFFLSEMCEPTGGAIHFGDCAFDRVSTDTRNIEKGDLFIALKGERFDAHEFLHEALNERAAGLVVDHINNSIHLPALVVKDTTAALGQIALRNRQEFTGPLLGITGSAGKTTVKTLLANILALKGSVLATKGNFNNHIGLPLTLLDLNESHDYAVLEMGASAQGEIAYLASLAKPEVVVITNAMRAHVEGFGSLEGVVKGKGEIYAALNAEGTAILNIDDNAAEQWKKIIGSRKCITFSVKNPEADVYAKSLQTEENGCPKFELVFNLNGIQESEEVVLQLLGAHNVGNALAAAAAALAVGVRIDEIKQGLQSCAAVKGRMQIRQGINGADLIDDTYNANPDAVKAAIDMLATSSKEKVLVLGDLGELGSEAAQMVREIGTYAKNRVDQLFTVGDIAANAAKGFGKEAQHFATQQQLTDSLKQQLHNNMIVLVKGSRASHMENVVTALQSVGEI